MIEQITNRTQTQYHQAAFKPKLLPDVDAAGPLSASTLSAMRDPIRFLTAGPKAQSADMAWGSLVDLLWLTPEDWDQYVVLKPSDAPKKPTAAQRNAAKPSQASINAIGWWDQFNARTLGKMVVDQALLDEVRAARDMLELHPISSYIWQCSQKQVMFAGSSDQLHPNGKTYQAKSMMDLLPMDGHVEIGGQRVDLNTCVVDLKQCHQVSDYGMKKATSTFEYHLKTEWYLNMLRASGQPQRDKAILIFQNSKEPRDVHVRLISEEDLALGRRLAIERMDMLPNLNHRDLRPLFDTEVKVLTLAKWMKEDEE